MLRALSDRIFVYKILNSYGKYGCLTRGWYSCKRIAAVKLKTLPNEPKNKKTRIELSYFVPTEQIAKKGEHL